MAITEGVGGRVTAVRRGGLGGLIACYAQHRGLSETQASVLILHFGGVHDKEIAGELSVSVTTVHEHWRRIARKTQCRTKSDVLADVYRYLSVHLEQHGESALGGVERLSCFQGQYGLAERCYLRFR